MIVVGDASPLIALAAVRQLDLLRQLYAEVVIPEAVFREVALVQPQAPGSADLRGADWIRVRAVRDVPLLRVLEGQLDPGEAAALALAVEIGADLLLMDERRGRSVAARLNQRVVGVLGVLVEAKGAGLVPLVQPLLDALSGDAGFYVSDALRSRVLESVGE